MSETCLFCGKPEKGYKPSKSVDFICSRCVQLLLAADQGRAYAGIRKSGSPGLHGQGERNQNFLDSGG